MDKKELYNEMKSRIGCDELTHEILAEYLCTGWRDRKLFSWEHCGMHFEKMYSPMCRQSLNFGVRMCLYDGKTYYFGLGLEEPVVTDDMLKNGKWLVYTWAD